jgi:hypothetical protein
MLELARDQAACAVHHQLRLRQPRHDFSYVTGATFGPSLSHARSLVIIICLLATTPRHEMHSASYVFGSEGVVNGTGGWNTGLAFLFGLLSVQWTMTDYDGKPTAPTIHLQKLIVLQRLLTSPRRSAVPPMLPLARSSSL